MTDTIQIDKDVPLRTLIDKYPFREMEVGDSFFVPNADMRRLSAEVSLAGKVLKCRFKTRAVQGGRRVWRVA